MLIGLTLCAVVQSNHGLKKAVFRNASSRLASAITAREILPNSEIIVPTYLLGHHRGFCNGQREAHKKKIGNLPGPIMRDIRPSSVVCSGTLSNLTWRKTCRYKNLYFVISEWTDAANERDSALIFSEWQRSHKVMAQDRPIHNLQSVPSEYLFVPRRVPISEVQEQLRTADNPLRSVSGYSILFNTFYPQAPGHLVWNDLFALFTALSDMGMAHGVAVRPILLSLKSYERGYCINELIERFLGSGPTLFAKDFVNHKQNVLVEHAVVGTGQGGADDAAAAALLQGRPGTRHAFRSFRPLDAAVWSRPGKTPVDRFQNCSLAPKGCGCR